MAEETETTTKKPSPRASASKASTRQAKAADQEPAIIDVKKKKKKKKYSRGVKDFQKVSSKLTKGQRRVARAVADGFSEFHSQNNKSSRKKRDGLLRDLHINGAKGLAEAISGAAKFPVDVANAFDTKTLRRGRKQAVRMMAGPFFR